MTRSLTRRTRVLAVGAALLIAVGALTGCTGRPGQAADLRYTGLDGARHSIIVTDAEVQAATKEITNYTSTHGQEAPAAATVASGIIEAPMLTEVGQAHGITITDEQVVQSVKEQDGFEVRNPATIAFLRANFLVRQFQQQQDVLQAVQADYVKIRATRTGAVSPRYPEKDPEWFTQTDPRLSSTGNPTDNPSGGGQQQAPQQDGGQQQPTQQQPTQQPTQEEGQQAVPSEGAGQPSDDARTQDDQEDGQGSEGGADSQQPGQDDGGIGEGDVDQSEDGAQ